MAKRSILSALSSLQLTTVALLVLFVVVLVGTFYQVDHSIYETTTDVFHAWIYWWGPVPLPAGQTVFLVLGVNLVFAMVTRIPWRFSKIGIWIVHLGLVLMVAGGLVTRFFVRESILALAEGESGDKSFDPRLWDIVVVSDGDETIFTVPAESLGPYGTVARYLPDAIPLRAGFLETINVFGARDLAAPEGRRENPVPGVVLDYGGREILLHGADGRATVAPDGTQFLLRPRRFPLPVTLTLRSFTAEFYQDSDVPKEFTSHVTVDDGGVERDVVIAMNKPLHLTSTTFYQLAYDTAVPDREVSVFSVVHNPARWLPYVVSLLISSGLFIHFVLRLRETRSSGGL